MKKVISHAHFGKFVFFCFFDCIQIPLCHRLSPIHTYIYSVTTLTWYYKKYKAFDPCALYTLSYANSFFSIHALEIYSNALTATTTLQTKKRRYNGHMGEKRERERAKSESVEAKRYMCVCDALEAHRKCTLCSHDNRHTRRTAGKQQQQIDRNDTRLTHEVQIVTHTQHCSLVRIVVLFWVIYFLILSPPPSTSPIFIVTFAHSWA